MARRRSAKVLSPAETLGLSGAILDARVRRAVNHIPDAELAIVARRLADDALANELIYERSGVVEAVRVMLRPLLVMPEQLSYLHHVCTRVMTALARIPDLFMRDPDVRKILPLAPDEAAWFEETWAQIEQGHQSALRPARRRLRLHERALARLAALHGAEPVGRRRNPPRAAGRDAADARRRARRSTRTTRP